MIFTGEEVTLRNKRWGDEMRTRLANSPAKGLDEVTDIITDSVVRELDVLSPQVMAANDEWRVDGECHRLANRCCDILVRRHYLTETWLLLTCTKEELLGMTNFGPKMLTIVKGCLAHYDLALREEK